MTQPLNSGLPPAVSQQPLQYSLEHLVLGSSFSAGATALSAGIFTATNPLAGAVFGLTSFLCGRLINWIYDREFDSSESMISTITRFALATIGGIGAAIFLTTQAGFPMTFSTAVILSIGSIGVSLLASTVMMCCLCSSVLITGAVIGDGQNTSP